MIDVAAKLAKTAVRKAFRADNRKFIAATGGKKAKKAKRPKSLSNSKLEALRWESFAAVIRERDAYAGCFSCDGGAAESAGHLISRRKLATKYDERNVLGQCLTCNWADKFRPGFHDRCVSRFIRGHGLQGEALYHEIVAKSNETTHESRHENIVAAWEYMNRMADGERKDRIRKKLAPLVPVAQGGTKAE